MTTNSKSCPSNQTLIDFLLGKLSPGELEFCENHLNQCQPCGDTINNLNVNDTFVSLTDQAKFQSGNTSESSDEVVVDMLIEKLVQQSTQTNQLDFGSTPPSARITEVVQLLQPSQIKNHLGRLSHYEVQEVLGVGATSVVFLAHDEQLHRQVALKVLRPSLGQQARERFLAEARAAAAIDHENVITIFQVGIEGELAFMAQQWLPGETLQTKVETNQSFDLDWIRNLAIQLAEGLAAAHRKNLIHRDIKPANIWIESERNRAIILDFGLVRVADDGPNMTETGMIAGTPMYMSPEQARGRDIDQRSDLFSLGCVLYQICTGRTPFKATNTLALLDLIQNSEPIAPRELNSNVPADLSALIKVMLNKDPDRRPQSASQLIEWIKNPSTMKAEIARLTSKKSVSQKPAQISRKAFWLWGAAAVILISLFALAIANPQIVRIVTNHGVLEIKSDDPDIAIEILQGGEVVYVADEKTGQKIEIKSGEYQLRPKSDENSFQLSQNSLTMSRGGRIIVTVTNLDHKNTDGLPSNEIKGPNSISDSTGESQEDFDRRGKIQALTNRIRSLAEERDAVEATFDTEGGIAITGSIIDCYKQLVSVAIGHEEKHTVDGFKEQMMAEYAHMHELASVSPSEGLLSQLEQHVDEARKQLNDALPTVSPENFFEIKAMEVEFLSREVELAKYRNEYFVAVTKLQKILNLRQELYDKTQEYARAGKTNLEISSEDAKTKLLMARGELEQIESLNKYMLEYSKIQQSSEILGLPVASNFPESNNKTPNERHKPESPKFNGKTLDEWIDVIKTERSPAQVNTALRAVNTLTNEKQLPKIAQHLISLIDVYGGPALIGSDEAAIQDNINAILSDLSNDDYVELVADALTQGGSNARKFFLRFPYSRPESDSFSAAAQKQKNKLLQCLLNSGERDDIDGLCLLARLAMAFDWRSPEIDQAMVTAFDSKIEDEEINIAIMYYLTHHLPKTKNLEKELLELSQPRMSLETGKIDLTRESLFAIESLAELGPDNVSKKTIDRFIEVLAHQVVADWGNPTRVAIDALGYLGPKAKKAVPDLQKICYDPKNFQWEPSPYSKPAGRALVKILAPSNQVEDLLAMQGTWDVKQSEISRYREVDELDESEFVVIRGFRMKFMKGKGFSAKLAETNMRLNETKGQIYCDFMESTEFPLATIFEVDGDQLKFTINERKNDGFPESLDIDDKWFTRFHLEKRK